jgi:hypothetical protein
VSGLFLSQVAAPGFGARVSRNDITDSAVRVSHAAGYGLASELSTEARWQQLGSRRLPRLREGR